MTYRGVVRHVRYWRGAIHRWSTVYQFVGVLSKDLDTTAATLLLDKDDGMCWGPSASVGGTYQCELYDNTAGGAPLITYTRFDYTVTADWTGFGGAGWTTDSGFQEQSAEAALQVEWNAGISKSGKPVKLRKWYHAVPDPGALAGGPDVVSDDVTSLVAYANELVDVLTDYNLVLGSSTGRFAGDASVSSYWGNHQMPRGRRRPPLVTADGTYKGPTIKGPTGLFVE
jgi:hypothetical protein